MKRREFFQGMFLAAAAGTGMNLPAAEAMGERKTFLQRLAENRPFFIGHRGCQPLAPENTIPSFVCACRLGIQAIETDVQRTKDGVLVCSHDADMKRVFGADLKISQTTYADLCRFPAKIGKKWATWDPSLLRLPTFDEYLEICARYDKVPFIETKGDVSIVKDVLQAVEKRKMMRIAVLSSIQFPHIEETRRLNGEIFIHHIFSTPELMEKIAKMGNGGLSYNYPKLEDVPKRLIEKTHEKGVKVCLRAGDSAEAVRRMLAMGLDYIPSNNAIPLVWQAAMPPAG